MKLGRIISCTHGEKQHHQFLSNYDEKQKSFKYMTFNGRFFHLGQVNRALELWSYDTTNQQL